MKREIGSCLDRDILYRMDIKNEEWLKNEDNYHGADSHHGDRDQVSVVVQSEELEQRVDNPAVN